MTSFKYEAMKLVGLCEKMQVALDIAGQSILGNDPCDEHISKAIELVASLHEEILLAGEAVEEWPDGGMGGATDDEDVAYARVGMPVYKKFNKTKGLVSERVGVIIDMSSEWCFIEWYDGGTEGLKWRDVSLAKVRPRLAMVDSQEGGG